MRIGIGRWLHGMGTGRSSCRSSVSIAQSPRAHPRVSGSSCSAPRPWTFADDSHGNLDGGIAVPDPASTYFVSMHNNATILANTYMNSPTPLDTDDKDRDLKLSNLRKVKWARFDYITEWEMCARWMVTRPPWLLFVSDHGKELRFLGTRSISPEGKKLFSFMAYRNWETLTTWKPIPF
jgi:hypothetical protein